LLSLRAEVAIMKYLVAWLLGVPLSILALVYVVTHIF